MRKIFYIERWGGWDERLGDFGDHAVLSDSPIIFRFNCYGMMFEDLRTVIELNKTIEDILTNKYVFLKLAPIAKMSKRMRDLEDAKLELETYNTLLIQSLFTTSIVTYAKWFTQSSDKKSKLEASVVFKNSGTRTKLTHDLVMTYRHQYFAHSGGTELERTFPLYITDPKNPDDEHLFAIPQKKRLPTLTEVRRFHSLFRKVTLHVQDKMMEMKPNVIKIIKAELEVKEHNLRKKIKL